MQGRGRRGPLPIGSRILQPFENVVLLRGVGVLFTATMGLDSSTSPN
jgi:hypothetical protein